MIRDLVRIKYCVVLQESNCHHAGSPALPAPGRQIFGYPPASGSKTALTRISLYCLFLVASFGASSYLAHFLVRSVGRPCFCFMRSWTVDLAMGGAELKGTDDAVGFSGWSLRKVLTIFQRCMTAEKGS